MVARLKRPADIRAKLLPLDLQNDINMGKLKDPLQVQHVTQAASG